MTAKRPVQPADLSLFHPVSDPRISPDGKAIAYVVESIDLEQNERRKALWLVAAGGGAPRQLTSPASGSDWAPRWAPDSASIAFCSTRSGKPQFWVIPADGGEARRIETEQAPAGAPVWSPDGSRIAFAARVFDQPEAWVPYAAAPEGDRKRAAGDSEVKVITRLKFRFDGMGYFGEKRMHLFVVPADGSGPARQISSGDFDHTSPAWTPDGTRLICAARRHPDADELNCQDLWSFDVASGEAVLVCPWTGPIMFPRVSPDGRWLSFEGHPYLEKHVGHQMHLMLVRLQGGRAVGEPVSLSAPLDRPVPCYTMTDLHLPALGAHQWAPDSRGIFALVGDGGLDSLYHFPLEGEARRLTAWQDRYLNEFSVSEGGTIAMLIGEGAHPDEIHVRIDGDERRLTDHNSAVRELALVAPERFTYNAADGWPMEGWVIKPVGFEVGKPCPAVLDIHGGPQAAWGQPWFSFQVMASAGFAVVYANPRGSSGYGQAFLDAVARDWGGKDFQDLMAAVDHVVELGIADPDRLGVMGWSYGGYMTAWTVTQTGRFKAAVTGAPVIDRFSMIGTTDVAGFMEYNAGGNPWTREGEEQLLSRSPIRYVGQVTTPTMVVCAEGDLRCPISQAEEFYIALKRLGKADTVFIRYPGGSHWPLKPAHEVDRLERYVAWFRHYFI